MTELRRDKTFEPSSGTFKQILRFVERTILICGAVIGSLLALWYVGFLGWGLLQSRPPRPPFTTNLFQKLLGFLIIIIAFIIPAGGAFACVKALLSNKVLWPVIAAISAGLIGASIMFVGFGIGWSYHPDANKLSGIIAITLTGVLSMSPYILIAISRIKKTS